jgi:hypothetical protein
MKNRHGPSNQNGLGTYRFRRKRANAGFGLCLSDDGRGFHFGLPIQCLCPILRKFFNFSLPLRFFSHPVLLTLLSFSFTGLPDAASEEAASWVEPDNKRTVLIDASTAFRTDDSWTYGFPGMCSILLTLSCRIAPKRPETLEKYRLPFLLNFIQFSHSIFPHHFFVLTELSPEQREALTKSKRISNPGCYPTGFIGLTRPLVDAGIIPKGTPLTVNAISGYSGGGKGLMEIFEGSDDHEPWGAYGFGLVRIFCFQSLF